MTYVPPTACEQAVSYLNIQIEGLEREVSDTQVRIDVLRTVRLEIESYRDAEARQNAKKKSRAEADISEERSS